MPIRATRVLALFNMNQRTARATLFALFLLLLASFTTPPLRWILWGACGLIALDDIATAVLMRRGFTLQKRMDFAAADRAFRRAYRFIPLWHDNERKSAMVMISTVAFDRGLLSETVIWAERALAAGLNPRLAISAHSMAGIGRNDTAEIDEANRHFQAGMQLAQAYGQKTSQARIAGLLAANLKKSGRFAEAIAASERAETIDAQGRQTPMTCRYETYVAQGRFDEARRVLAELRKIPISYRPSQPDIEREARMQAVFDMSLASLEVEAGNWEEALRLVQATAPRLKPDAKLYLNLLATQACALGELGRCDEARVLAREIEKLGATLQGNRYSRLNTEKAAAHYELHCGDGAKSRAHWETYLRGKPDPYNAPQAHFFIGESHLKDGDQKGAIAAYKVALAPGIETLYAGKARARLAELGAS